MAQDAGDVRVAGEANIYLAPLATAFPDFEVAPIAPWVDLGFVTPDGITATFGREVNEIYAMQSAEPIRVIATKLPKTIGFNMMQQGRNQLLLALGGGAFTLEDVGVYRYEPPEPSVVDERAMILQIVDGTNKYRWHYVRTQNREGVEHKYLREDAATFPVSMQILEPTTSVKPFYMLTDDTAYAP